MAVLAVGDIVRLNKRGLSDLQTNPNRNKVARIEKIEEREFYDPLAYLNQSLITSSVDTSTIDVTWLELEGNYLHFEL